MKCDPEVFWESVIKTQWAFQGVWAEYSHAPGQPVVLNGRYALTTPESVSPQRIFHVFPRQSPKFLSCSFMVLQRAALTHSPPPRLFLNQGHGLYSQKRQKQETVGKAVWIWHNSSSSSSSSQTQKRPTDRTDRAQEVVHPVVEDKILSVFSLRMFT